MSDQVKRIKLFNKFNIRYVVLAGTPKHSNIGDRAIAYAEIEFIKKTFPLRPIVEIPFGFDVTLMPELHKRTPVILHGGGNFGDVWVDEEQYRISLIEKFHKNKIVMFPQTMYFSDKKILSHSVSVYSRHSDLTLILRESQSFEDAKRHFRDNKVLLAPDIVMSLSSENSDAENREGVLMVMRSDKERIVDGRFETAIKELINSKFAGKFLDSDMHIQNTAIELNKSHEDITVKKLSQFLTAKLVITDRLHGMIFSLITGTPCIVFGSKTHKTIGVFGWIKQAGFDNYIKFCSDADELEYILSSLDLEESYVYQPGKYLEYWKAIKSTVKGSHV